MWCLSLCTDWSEVETDLRFKIPPADIQRKMHSITMVAVLLYYKAVKCPAMAEKGLKPLIVLFHLQHLRK